MEIVFTIRVLEGRKFLTIGVLNLTNRYHDNIYSKRSL